MDLKPGDIIFHQEYGKCRFERLARFTSDGKPTTEFAIITHGKEWYSVLIADLCKDEHKGKVDYLNTGEGQTFVELLRNYEHTMYAKVRYPDSFFNRYERLTGIHLTHDTPGILISKQKDKWADEMLISFKLNDFEPNFPHNAKPRLYDKGKGILNDNAYIWILIEHYGFRFGKTSDKTIGSIQNAEVV